VRDEILRPKGPKCEVFQQVDSRAGVLGEEQRALSPSAGGPGRVL